MKGRALAVSAMALALVAWSGAACGRSRASTGGGPVTVLAAASLTEAFTAAGRALRHAGTGIDTTFSFAGSQQLVAQVKAGAPADVVATADTASMDALVAAGLVEPPRTFATNVLELAVRPGNPKHVGGLADLARADLAVVLADASVPAGRYATQALDRAGLHVHPKSLELDVKAAVRKVASGEADAAVVYATDVRAAGTTVAGVAIPDAQNVRATYPIAVVKASAHAAVARAFVEAMLHGEGRDALAAQGFGPP